MNNSRLGCLSINAIITTVITLLILGGFFIVKGSAMFSPGPLNAQASGLNLGGVRSHAEIGDDCAVCHTPFWGEAWMTDRCLECHTGLMEQKKDFHVIMFSQGELEACQSCHTEHHGAEAPLTNKEMVGFPHDQVGFSLKAHLKHTDGSSFACADCHQSTFSKPETAVCIDCHASYEAEVMQQHQLDFPGDCLGCHDGVDRYSDFDHGKVPFRLEGKHLEIQCSDCHQNANTIAELQGLQWECVSCHTEDNPHADQFSKTCDTCHSAESWKPTTFNHDESFFQLTGLHLTLECNTCHNSAGPSGERLYVGLPTDCNSCHVEDEPHEGRFGTDCETCHTTEGWWPAEFDHNLAAFHLEGKHQDVACEDCHTTILADGRPVFKGAPADCFSCHKEEDAHGGNLGTDCAECHTPVDWKPSTFDHKQSTFLLTGLHAAVECNDCHNQKDSSGHRIYRGTPRDCYSCHKDDDEHKGEFGTDCLSCHSTNGWVPSTFDHSKAVFPLTGAHIDAACKSCHTSGWKGTPTACVSCHTKDDQHKGQFGTDCQTCHSTSAWRPATFDHSRSSFKLTGAHVNTACKSCHTSGWKGTPTACASCHRDAHGGQFGSSCSTCHSTSAWRPASYNGPHSFPMTHGRADSCSDCHPGGFRSWTCYTCHNQGEMANKHSEEGIGDFSNCLRCHPNGQKEEGGGGDD